MKKQISLMFLISASHLYTMNIPNTTIIPMQNPDALSNYSNKMKVNIELITTCHDGITYTITQAFLTNNNIIDLKHILKRITTKKMLLIVKDKIERHLIHEHNTHLQDRRNIIMPLIEQCNNEMLSEHELANLYNEASDHTGFYYYTFEHQ